MIYGHMLQIVVVRVSSIHVCVCIYVQTIETCTGMDLGLATAPYSVSSNTTNLDIKLTNIDTKTLFDNSI